jgi:signal transduction histidine kinase
VVALQGEDRLLLDAVDVEGRRVVAATRYLPTLDWGLTVTVPRDELLEPVRAGTAATVVLTVAVAVLAALAAVLVARWLTSPIRALRDVAVAARGGGGPPADEHAPGELGDLAAALNAMITDLRRQQRDQVRRYEDLEVVTHAMAHDLRTPLTSIRGTLESLALGRVVDQAERQRMLERGVAASVRLEQLIDDLLDLIRTIGDPFEDRPVVLGDVMVGAVEQLGLGGVVDVGPLPVVRGDEVLLERLAANLISNAAKFHPEGTAVRVAVTADAPVGGRVDVHVDDAGIGIPEAERRAVLDAFARGTRAPGFHGSGLGLAIASRVAHRHGGALRIGDSPLGGTRVTVTLPVDPGTGLGRRRPTRAPSRDLGAGNWDTCRASEDGDGAPAQCASRTVKRSSRRSTRRGAPKQVETCSEVIVSSMGPADTTRPSRSSRACVKPGGISSGWWVTSTMPAGRSMRARPPSVTSSISRPTRSRPAVGSSSSSSSGSVIMARASWTRWR